MLPQGTRATAARRGGRPGKAANETMLPSKSFNYEDLPVKENGQNKQTRGVERR